MKEKKYYAYFVAGSGKKGVTDNWAECEKIVSGKDARFKAFKIEREAEVWLESGAEYEKKQKPKFEKGIYFDAGTGRGEGVEVSVTDEKRRNLLHKVLSLKKINKFGKHLVGKESTNNFGELLAMKYAFEIAAKSGVKKIFGDSRLVINYWSKGFFNKKNIPEDTIKLILEVSDLRGEFEDEGGEVCYISGDYNPADLGFH